MIENVRKYPVIMVVVISLYYLTGIIGLSLESTRALFIALVPYTLLFSLYFLWLFQEVKNMRFYLAGLVIFIAGFAAEVIGVSTGVIFGEYSYGKTLGVKLLETPVIIGVNWLLLILSCWALTGLVLRRSWLRILAGSVLMVIYDIFLEPAAIRFDMWNWQGDIVPVQNYTGWFFTSALFFVILDISKTEMKNKIAPALFIIQVLFFIILNVLFYLT